MESYEYVRNKLKEWKLEEYIDIFIEKGVDEETFKELTYKEWNQLILPLRDQIKFRRQHDRDFGQRSLEQPQQPSTSAEPSQHGDETELASDEPGVKYAAQPGTSDAAEKGTKYEKDIQALVFLRGVKHDSTFHLGSDVKAVHPFDDIFYLQRRKGRKGRWEWTAVLCQLKYNESGKLCKSNVIKTKESTDRNKEKFNCLKYGRLSIQKKKEMDSFINECIAEAKKEDDSIADIEHITKKYILFTNAPVSGDNEDLRAMLDYCQVFDELLKTGDDSEAFSFIQNGLAVDQTGSNLEKSIKEYIENTEKKIKLLEDMLQKRKKKNSSTSTPINENETVTEEKSENIEIKLKEDLKRLKVGFLNVDQRGLNDFFKNLILCSNQMPATLENDQKCALACLLRRELKNALNVDLSDRSQEDKVLEHFKSEVQRKLGDQFKAKTTITNRAMFLKPIRGAIEALNTSTLTIKKWQQTFKNYKVSKDVKNADSKTKDIRCAMRTDNIRYFVNNDSVAWTTLKLTSYNRSHLNKCTVHDMKYVIDNRYKVIEALKVPCYSQHVFTCENKLNVDTEGQVKLLAEDIYNEILVQDKNKDKDVILITKTYCKVTKALVDRICMLQQ